MNDLRVTLVQTPLAWEDASANRTTLENTLADLAGTTDLVILPEMFATGFTMRPKALSEPEFGPSFQWMQAQAKKLNAVICGSMATEAAGKYYNRLYWVRPDGTHSYYDKRHLFRMGEEHAHYEGGNERLIVTLNGWRICPLVCYDLRFPVWSRNASLTGETSNHEYDLLIYVANWPKVRRYPWSTLLLSRAIENQCYVAGVNRIGLDGNGIDHSGDSVLVDPKGFVFSTLEPDQAVVETSHLSWEALDAFRQKFPVGLDADRFSINR